MTGCARGGRNGRRTHVRRAFALAAALWIAVPAAHADDGMIVIPGRGETAEHALATAAAASGGLAGGNARSAAAAMNGAPAGAAMQPMNAVSIPQDRAANPPATYRAATRSGQPAADPGGIVTVVAGAADAASNAARAPQPPAIAARPVSLRAVTPAARTAAAAGVPAAAAPTAVAPAQQDPDTIRRAALAFLQQQIAGLPGKTTATVAPAFPRGLAACTTLEPFLPTGARLWGRTTVGVRCAGERPWTVYLQAKVAVQATYYVAARQIAPGEPLSAADLVARDGDLTVLPLAVITDPAQAIGATALARIAAGLPLRQDMLKSAASVSAGQTVRVVAAGPGFTISAEGSALANAAPGQSVRVRMAAGQIVTAIVKDAGTVEIPL
ncbi:flagellar basal body P-ring formation chaperone FlgA [Burkholderia pseudomultivorans]|uniref:Flagellar biosynthesis protein FlgA n=1 Tax=Burkholderia pseudomultivorans TaxID=1207504 RepID=A0A132EDS8_9BURK|nr:flagellar basal body P-ring formation chaperone FlgA [Burkholderia pseudomultivorans]KWF25743.1 flagellar biosynthesis protein FlgA [Burkholderia pseudomultivorans]